MKPQEWYNNVLSETNKELDTVNKKILYISIIRVMLFIGCIITIYALWAYSIATIILSSLCTAIPFLIMIKIHNNFFYRKQWLEIKSDIIE